MDEGGQNFCSCLPKPVKLSLLTLATILSVVMIIVTCVYAVPPDAPDDENGESDLRLNIEEVIPTLEEIRATGENLTSVGAISVWKKRLAKNLVSQDDWGLRYEFLRRKN